MGANLPLFTREGDDAGTQIRTADGEVRVIPKKADFGTLSSGGLY
jgi:penicillin-binding protein 1A